MCETGTGAFAKNFAFKPDEDREQAWRKNPTPG